MLTPAREEKARTGSRDSAHLARQGTTPPHVPFPGRLAASARRPLGARGFSHSSACARARAVRWDLRGARAGRVRDGRLPRPARSLPRARCLNCRSRTQRASRGAVRARPPLHLHSDSGAGRRAQSGSWTRTNLLWRRAAGARSLVKSLVHVPCPPAQAAARARAERLGPRAERIGRSSKAGC